MTPDTQISNTEGDCSHGLQLIFNEDPEMLHLNYDEDAKVYTLSNDDDIPARCHVDFMCVECGENVSIKATGQIVHAKQGDENL